MDYKERIIKIITGLKSEIKSGLTRTDAVAIVINEALDGNDAFYNLGEAFIEEQLDKAYAEDDGVTTIKLEIFNECHGTASVQQSLEEWHLFDTYEIADAPKETEFWQNDAATLVLRQKTNGIAPTFITGLNIARLVQEQGPDEFNTQTIDYRSYIRLWWD